jgi:hypothetical protein
MLIAQILSFIYATINGLAWDRLMSFAFIIGISYIIYIKLKYEMHKDIAVEMDLRQKNILE